MHRFPCWLFVSATLSLAAAAPTQKPGAMTPFSLAAPPATAAQIDEPFGDGVFWVRGTTYKARVDAAGVMFVPRFVAAREPTPMRLRYHAAAAAKVERDGQALVLRHGAVVERWQTEPQGMEQSFVIASRPATADLTLLVDVETSLRYRGYDRGLVFTADGLGEITYGEGVVFDHAGRRAVVVPEFDGTTIALHVPAEFLAAAQYPVTIDPFLANFTVSQSGDNDFHPDIVRVPSADDFVVVFEEVFTSSDHDIVLHRYRSDGTFVSRVFLDNTLDTCSDPKVCATLGGATVLAIWDNDGSNKGIQARRYQLSPSTLGGTAQVTSDGIGVDSRSPDVGGGTLLGVNNIGQMAVYVRVVGGINASLRGISLQASGIPAANEFVIDSSPGCDPRPDISPSGGNPLFWGVAWQKNNALCNDSDIYWAAVNLGGLIHGPTAVNATQSTDELNPHAFTYDKDTLITWQNPSASFGWDAAAALFRRSVSGNLFPVVGPHVSLSANEPSCPRALDQTQPAIGFDGTRHAYVYMENQRPKAACMFADTYLFSEGHAALSATTNNCGAPAIAHVPTPDSPVRYAVVWQEDVGPRFEVRGAFYEARQPGATVAAVDTGCGAHGFETQIGIDQVPAVGHDFTVSLTGVSGLPLLLVGPAAPTPVLLCGGLSPCKQGITNILASVFAPSLQVALPGDSSFVGMSLAFQGADVGASGGCGTALFGLPFRTTDTLIVTFR